MQYTGLLKFLLHECKLKCISERKVLHSYLCKMSLNGGKLRSKILVKRGHYTWSIYWPGGGFKVVFLKISTSSFLQTSTFVIYLIFHFMTFFV